MTTVRRGCRCVPRNPAPPLWVPRSPSLRFRASRARTWLRVSHGAGLLAAKADIGESKVEACQPGTIRTGLMPRDQRTWENPSSACPQRGSGHDLYACGSRAAWRLLLPSQTGTGYSQGRNPGETAPAGFIHLFPERKISCQESQACASCACAFGAPQSRIFHEEFVLQSRWRWGVSSLPR